MQFPVVIIQMFFSNKCWYSYFQDSLNPVVTRIFRGKPMENHQGKPLEIARLLALYSAVAPFWGCWWNQPNVTVRNAKGPTKIHPKYHGGVCFFYLFVENKCGNSRCTKGLFCISKFWQFWLDCFGVDFNVLQTIDPTCSRCVKRLFQTKINGRGRFTPAGLGLGCTYL